MEWYEYAVKHLRGFRDIEWVCFGITAIAYWGAVTVAFTKRLLRFILKDKWGIENGEHKPYKPHS